jgi:phage protein D
VRGWDPLVKEPILGFCEAVSEAFDGTTGPATAGTAHYGAAGTGRTITIVDVPVASQEEADQLAASIFDQQAMDFLTADVMIEGVPSASAGDIVELKQFGTRYSGKYLVQSAQHLVQGGAKNPYTTRFQLIRNAAPEP